jgi:hypothetical protein
VKAKINNAGILALAYTQALRPGVKASFGLALDTQKLNEVSPTGPAHKVMLIPAYIWIDVLFAFRLVLTLFSRLERWRRTAGYGTKFVYLTLNTSHLKYAFALLRIQNYLWVGNSLLNNTF